MSPSKLWRQLPKTFRVALLSLLAVTCILLIRPALAQSNYLKDKQDAIKEGGNQESWLNESLGSNAMSLLQTMAGEIPDDILTGDILKNPHPIVWTPAGMLGITNNLVARLHTPPASGVEYLAQGWNNLIGKPAHAQGIGFNGLVPILPIWRGFRNVVYLLSSIVFIVIGLLIMFRVKISPQAVITIQNAIPKIITTLIFVTFSYAIAGVLIDFSYLLQAVVVAIFFQMRGLNFNQALIPWANPAQGTIITGAIGDFVQGLYNKLSTLIGGDGLFTYSALSNPDFDTIRNLAYRAAPGWLSSILLGGLLGSIVLGTFLSGLGQGLLGGLGSDITNIVGSAVGGLSGGTLAGLFFPLLISIMTSIWLIKLYFGLLKAYVTIIFKIVLGPLEIGIGAFPNSKIGFNSWVTDLIANISIFPIVNLFLILLNVIIDSFYKVWTNNVWAPGALWFTDSVNVMILASCIGLAGLALLSKLPDMIPQVVFQLKNPWGAAIGEGLKDVDIRSNPAFRFGKGAVAYRAADQLADNTGAPKGAVGNWIEGKFGPGAAKASSDAIKTTFGK